MKASPTPINPATEVSFQEALKLTGRSRRTLRYLMANGKLKSRHAIIPFTVKACAIDRSSLDAYMADKRWKRLPKKQKLSP